MSLGGILCKMKKCGGFPLSMYKLLVESCVFSITDYCSEVMGFKTHPAIEEIHNRALRAFLGLRKTAPMVGVKSELGWLDPRSRAHIKMTRYYFHLLKLPNSRLSKKILVYDLKPPISQQ